MSKISTQKIIRDLVKFSPRQGSGEEKTAVYLERQLRLAGVNFGSQNFAYQIPRGTAKLFVDGKAISAVASSFVSGRITNKSKILNSLKADSAEVNNINYNPKCSNFSIPRFFRRPAVTVKSIDIPKIRKAKRIEGSVKVTRFRAKVSNILVGNLINPKNILFCHYDCLYNGAIDNASGTAVLLTLIINNRKLLDDNLFVLAAAEELSFEKKPAYWGYGYRIFEQKYLKLMKRAEKILIVDGIGYAPTKKFAIPWLVFEAFPIRHVQALKKKITIISTNYNSLMPVYHSPLDNGQNIRKIYLDQASRIVLDLISKTK